MAGDAGIHHVAVGDHVSFWVGAGRDGLIDAAAMAMAHPTLPVHVAVYLLALRHPVLSPASCPPSPSWHPVGWSLASASAARTAMRWPAVAWTRPAVGGA
jgi:hypothetical protein